MLRYLSSLLALLLMAGVACAQTPVVMYQPTFSAQPAIAVTAGAYSAGYSIGGVLTVSNMLRMNGPGTGYVQNVSVVDHAGQTGSILLYAFSSNPTSSAFTDDSAASIAKADEPKILPGFPVTLSCTGAPTGMTAAPSTCSATNLAIPIRLSGATCSTGTGMCFTGYLAFVAGASRTQASTSDLSVTLSGPQD